MNFLTWLVQQSGWIGLYLFISNNSAPLSVLPQMFSTRRLLMQSLNLPQAEPKAAGWIFYKFRGTLLNTCRAKVQLGCVKKKKKKNEFWVMRMASSTIYILFWQCRCSGSHYPASWMLTHKHAAVLILRFLFLFFSTKLKRIWSKIEWKQTNELA